MPFLAITFPAIDPVAISIGPLAIRWYALAYICGIVFGWIYARTLIRNEKLWAGPAPIAPVQLDDFILWVTLGIILGGRTGYVLFYNLPFFVEHPAAVLKLWEGGMSFHGGFLGCVAAVMLFAIKNNISILSLGDITTAVAPIPACPGEWSFPMTRLNFSAIQASSTKRRSRASCCLRSWRSWCGWAR
jgi:phosphatidylglycerol:prolipoprotein diacylglycerol transferase